MIRISILIALALAYAFLVNLIPPIEGFERWQIVALINSVLAIPAMLFYKPKIEARDYYPWLAWIIGPVILMGTILILQYSEQGESEVLYSTLDIFAICLLVPVAEELIFRRTLFDDLSQRLAPAWAYYISAFIFALAHSDPMHLSVPLGPLFLGIIAAWAYHETGKLSAAVLIHSAGNGAAILVSLYAPTWLEKMTWLYQKL